MMFKRVWGGASLKTHLRFCESAVKSIQWANEPHTSPSFPFRGSWTVQNMCLCFKNRLIYIRGSCMVDWVSLTAQALPDSGTCCARRRACARAAYLSKLAFSIITTAEKCDCIIQKKKNGL